MPDDCWVIHLRYAVREDDPNFLTGPWCEPGTAVSYTTSDLNRVTCALCKQKYETALRSATGQLQ